MKRSIAAGLILVLHILPIQALAQNKKRSIQKPRPEVSTPAPGGKITYLEPSAKSKLMSQAWFEGKLPAPFELPADTTKYSDNAAFAKLQKLSVVDQNAALLAKMTTKGDERSVSAVVAALLEMGFAIEKPDGTRQKTSGAQGISIPEWQIAGAMKLYGQGQTFGLDSFEGAMTRAFPMLKNAKLGRMIIDDLREDLESSIPAKRSWANYIIGLGKNREKPYDLTSPAMNLDEISIDPLQNLLLTTRLAGDLVPLDRKMRAELAPSQQSAFRNVSYSPSAFLQPNRGENVLADDELCTIESNTSIFFDYAAMGNGAGFNRVVEGFREALKDLGQVAQAAQLGKLLTRLGIVNIILNIAKFYITFASIEVKIAMDGDSLTRTPTTKAGARKKLTATLETNTGKYKQIVNCIRPLLNLLGIDESVPTNGPMSNVKVTWILMDESDTMSAWVHNHNLEAPTFGNDHDSSGVKGVYLAESLNNFTDQNGVATIFAVGKPQDHDMSKEKLTRTQSTVRVGTFFQAKTSEPTSTAEVVGAVGDYLGPTISILLGDKLSGLIGLGLETAYRASWCPSEPYSFTVYDWLPCTDGWEGTVTMVRTLTAKEEIHATQGSIKKSSDVNVITMDAKVFAGDGPVRGIASVSDTTNSTYTDEYSGFCTQNLRTVGVKSGGGSSTVNGTIKINGDQFTIMLTTDNDLASTLIQKTTYDGTCADAHHEPRSETVPGKQKYALAVTDKFDTNNPYELKGSKTVVESDPLGELKTVYTWSLRRCH